ncbi:MAG: hypothetical protein A2015_12230 [Spirochaetes bacterium GWF1_31_7]|nr:MAG: hypothetical protein A2Y30_14845 [Spirochaetes bacterium GWE1_32_154]OHD49183.1 MAG: hypothetical protein A2015_12230 [Spirochaetes bacterium GWF1_31_7]OHD50232.1 MAG: hypothetical protein A2Y29_12895 [Spirochaetes bacterium GWE2_31_10]OHD76626.1 MAG: hypothetical protein A2355_13660 [Spirochaetes bacterium RIFOXYB1_FULL_32_8]HBD93986.1 hypothetical protein [Spirochaetia bacterium]
MIFSKSIILFFLMVLLFTTCSKISPEDESIPGISGTQATIHKINPIDTDSSIDSSPYFHYAGINMNLPVKKILVLFLGGTSSDPASYSGLLSTPIGLGYHVISLQYPNATAVGGLALNNLNEYGLIRQEIIEGLDTTTSISITPENSIFNRINTLLIYLHNQYPTEDWGRYLLNNKVLWNSVIISGYSQGAGHAAWIAKKNQVKRLVLFSGVVDGKISDPRESASWITNTGWATPLSDIRYFISKNDGFYPAIKANLITLNENPDDTSMTASVNTENPPYRNLRLLLTSDVTGDRAHPSTCENGATPQLDNGVYQYQPVWNYLFN